MNLPFRPVLYKEVEATWPSKGRHILGNFTESTIVVYQAYKPSIALHAVTHGTFKGCPDFLESRMTWVKTNFLWMMYRSGWATKQNQERILAISITREGFEEILRNAKTKKPEPEVNESQSKLVGSSEASLGLGDDVRLQWDPDHDPFGDKVERRAIQLGIRGGGKVHERFLSEWITRIDDITEFVQEEYQVVLAKEIQRLQVPEEKVYQLLDPTLAQHITLDLD
jgi:hypothetical protein